MLRMSRSAGTYHHGDLRATLEESAIELLATQQASSLSLREVARRAGVSHNAPYHHFADRQGLLKAVAARSLQGLLTAMTDARASAETPREQLLAVGEAYIGYALRQPGGFGAIFDPEICDPSEPNPVTGPLIEANDDFLNETVAAAWPDLSDDDVRTAAAGLWGMVHGLAQLIADGHLPADVARPALESMLSLGRPV